MKIERKVKIKIAKVFIRTEFITLDSFLKLAGAVMSGGQAKVEIQEGNVFVNDEICKMRGKKLRIKDIVKYKNMSFEVCANESEGI